MRLASATGRKLLERPVKEERSGSESKKLPTEKSFFIIIRNLWMGEDGFPSRIPSSPRETPDGKWHGTEPLLQRRKTLPGEGGLTEKALSDEQLGRSFAADGIFRGKNPPETHENRLRKR